jgi:hypothetical protein
MRVRVRTSAAFLMPCRLPINARLAFFLHRATVRGFSVCVCVCARARATGPPFWACQYLCVLTRGGLWLTSSLKKTTQSMYTTAPVVATVVRVINTIHKSSPWTWPPRLGIRARVLLDATPPTVKCTPMLVPGRSGKS